MTKRNRDAIMSLFRNLFSCIGRAESQRGTSKVHFGRPLNEAFTQSSVGLPTPILELLIRLAQEGVEKRDLFRRPGNVADVKSLVLRLQEGLPIQWSNYKNVYTLALVMKRFLMEIPDGLYGSENEAKLLDLINDQNELDEKKVKEIYLSILSEKPLAVYQISVLLLGIWYHMVCLALAQRATTDSNTNMAESSLGFSWDESGESDISWQHHDQSWRIIECEAVAKSVAGSIFHTARDSPQAVTKAASILQFLIFSFPTLSEEAVDYFYKTTRKTSTVDTPSSTPGHQVQVLVRKASDKAISQLKEMTGKMSTLQSRSLPQSSNSGTKTSSCETGTHHVVSVLQHQSKSLSSSKEDVQTTGPEPEGNSNRLKTSAIFRPHEVRKRKRQIRGHLMPEGDFECSRPVNIHGTSSSFIEEQQADATRSVPAFTSSAPDLLEMAVLKDDLAELVSLPEPPLCYSSSYLN